MNINDSHEKISPADPRVTAYAFGELEGDELAAIEAAVQADPALQALVAELRAFSGQLSTALAGEPTDQEQDRDPHASSVIRVGPSSAKASGKKTGVLIRFPWPAFVTAAAACFTILVWVRHDSAPSPIHEQKRVADDAVVFVSKPDEGELEHRLRLARKPVTTPTPVASLSESPVFSTPDTLLAPVLAPEMPALPSTGASALAGVGFGGGLNESDTSSVGAVGGVVVGSTGYGTGLGFASGQGLGVAPMRFASATRSRGSLETANESYGCQPDNDYRTVAAEPLSTFSVDVDTASYANIRRFISGGHLPPRDAVRIEEMINYFPYRYASPATDRVDTDAANAAPFVAQLDIASAPWAPSHRLVRIGLKGRELTHANRPAANLVFLLDVSGSMNSANKLPLVKESLRLLVERLRPDDRVAIVTYAGGTGLALPSTPASQKREILTALESLNASGSTNGGMGIHLAYDIAKANFAANGLNRVILCTDGDFNVGVTNRDELVRLITEKARSHVFLSVFGFGMGNLKDNTLESLADKGNGAYGYIDTRREAEKVFVEQAEGTLATIAKDVKVQVEFNPARVTAYRLIGYENRLLKKEDFNNDAVDAGDIGAGHTVTALYEVLPVGVDWSTVMPVVDALKYQKTKAASVDVASLEMLTVKIRYKAPEADVSRRQEFPLIDTGTEFPKTNGEFQFAAAVAAWGMLLRDSPHKGSATFDQVINWAENGLGDDVSGYRAEFIQLVRRSAELIK